MSFDLNAWLKETIEIEKFGNGRFFQRIRPRIVCQDGFSVSVQASSAHYCCPRYDQYQEGAVWHVENRSEYLSSSMPMRFDSDTFIPYKEVELGYPSEEDELIKEYAENEEDYTATVYGYVPVIIVEALIEKHGGFRGVENELPDNADLTSDCKKLINKLDTEENDGPHQIHVEEECSWHADLMEIARRVVDSTEEERLKNVAEHFEVDLSEIREYLENKKQAVGKKRTKFERIKAMTMEEMVNFLRGLIREAQLGSMDEKGVVPARYLTLGDYSECERIPWTEWLKLDEYEG